MKKILIIENDDLFAQNMKFQLEQDLYEVFNAPNGELGLDLAKSVRPNLILSDINLSGMDGFAVCKEIRNNTTTKDIPFVFLTARSKFADKEKALAIGANKFLTKPLKIKALKDVIYELIGKSTPANEKLLLISEDAQYSNVLKDYLTKQGYQVSLIGFAPDAIRSITSIKPAVIILDSLQDFDDVYDTIKLITEDPAVYECPTIVLGPKGDATVFRRYMDTEISDYLVKPVEPGDILHSIELQLEKTMFGKLLDSDFTSDNARFIDKEMEYAIATRKELRKRRQKCILLIEDDDNLISNLRLQLELNSYVVLSAFDGERGLLLAEQNLPDLIISDIMLPGISGYEVRAQLNNNALTRNIPFLFHSAKVEYADIRKGMSLGADDYLTKPIKIKSLLKIIKKKLSNANPPTQKMSDTTVKPTEEIRIAAATREEITPTDIGSFQKLLINARETVHQEEPATSQDSELEWQPILEEQVIPQDISLPVTSPAPDNSVFAPYFTETAPNEDERILSTFVPHSPQKSNYSEFQSFSRNDIVIIRVNISRCIEKDIKGFQLFLLANFRQEKTKYIVDLLKTDFMDSSFLGSLVVFQKKVIEHDGELSLVVKNDLMMNNSMFLYGISRKFTLHNDVISAINS
jgi:DNA-binding response OmpR family regulator